MTLVAGHPALQRELARLSPYARLAVERAARFALWLHAAELVPEHLLASLLEDEECAATQLVLHAFADPQTIGGEILALCPGILVVGSGRSLPFSVCGLRALENARRRAGQNGSEAVHPFHVFRAALEELPSELQEALLAAGLQELPAPSGPAAAAREALPLEGALFRHFSPTARRALGAACRAADRLQRNSISPAHLLLGCLEAEETLREQAGLTPARLHLILAGADADDTPLEERALEPGPALLELLSALPAGSGTMEILGEILTHGREEVRALLQRQKITTALHQRSAKAFRDPEPPSSEKD